MKKKRRLTDFLHIWSVNRFFVVLPHRRSGGRVVHMGRGRVDGDLRDLGIAEKDDVLSNQRFESAT